jgi:hypothetical protein
VQQYRTTMAKQLLLKGLKNCNPIPPELMKKLLKRIESFNKKAN